MVFSRGYIVCICIFAILGAAGCGGPKVTPIDLSKIPQRYETAAEVVALVNAGADSIRAVRADLDLSFRKGPGAKPRRCSGKLISLRGPRGTDASIYLKGYRRLAPTFFTLVSDGTEFWLHVPSKNTVYTGPVVRERPEQAPVGPGASASSAEDQGDTTAIDLEAADLSRALFVEPIDTVLDCRMSFDDGHYILEVVENGVVRRRLRIEGMRLCVVGETYYTPEGVEELDLFRSQFTMDAGAPYPRHIVIARPASGKEVTLDIGKLDLAPPDPRTAAFRFVPPGGARIERIE